MRAVYTKDYDNYGISFMHIVTSNEERTATPRLTTMLRSSTSNKRIPVCTKQPLTDHISITQSLRTMHCNAINVANVQTYKQSI